MPQPYGANSPRPSAINAPASMLKPVTTANTTTTKSRFSRFLPASDNDRRFVVRFGVALFLVASFAYNAAIYQSFGVVRVLIAALLFFAIVVVFFITTSRGESLSTRLPSNPWSWMWGSGVGLFAWVSSFPGKRQYTNYYPAFPLEQIDAGGVVAQDTIFHSTLINSIINFGYPSSGLSDVPWMIYHTLSHYVESAFYVVSGLEPFDGAGLFFNLKIMVLISSLLLFIGTTTKNRSFITFLVTAAIGLPVLVSGWIVIGSLSLWLTTIIIVASAGFTYRALFSSDTPSPTTLVGLGVIGVVLSFGKISSGVMYMLVVGISLFMAHFRKRRIYLLGTAWLAFIAIYGWFFTLDRSTEGATAPVSLGDRIDTLTTFLMLQGKFVPFARDLYVLGLILAIVVLVYRRPSTIRLFTSLVTGFVAVCAMWFLQLNTHDIRYFEQALFFVVLLLALIDFTHIRSTDTPAPVIRNVLAPRAVYSVIVIVAILSTAGLGRAPINVFTPSRSTVIEAFTPPAAKPPTAEPNLATFRTDLRSFMQSNGLTAKNSLVFIPTEIWLSEASRLSSGNTLKKSWVNPILVYAVTGVPLLNGVVERTESYGFSSYDDTDLSIPQSEFAQSDACRFNKTVIEVTSWSPATFVTHCGPADD